MCYFYGSIGDSEKLEYYLRCKEGHMNLYFMWHSAIQKYIEL